MIVAMLCTGNISREPTLTMPIGSMYGIFTYIGIILNYFRVNVGKYSIHGSSGMGNTTKQLLY